MRLTSALEAPISGMDDTTKHFILAGVLLLVGIGSLLYFIVALLTFRVWIRAKVGGVRVSVFEIVRMRLRGVPPGLLVDALLDLKRQGAEASAAEVESAYLNFEEKRWTAAELADALLERRA